MHPSLDRPIQLHLLGEFDISVANTRAGSAIGYLKPRLLLAMLALAQGKPYLRTELADVLWPDDVRDGRGNLRHALFVLRRLLESVPDAWLSTGKTLALNPDRVMVDVLAVMGAAGYESMSPAQRLSYDQGRFLEYAELPESAAFTVWKTNWQSHVERHLAQCRGMLVADLQAAGQSSQALIHAKQWVQQHPEDEGAHRLLIRLLLSSHDRDAALQAYQHCVCMMRQYFDSEPSAPVRDLIEHESLSLPHDDAGSRAASESRPLGALAVTLSVDDAPDNQDDLLHDLHAARRRIQHLARREGGYVLAGADDSVVVVYGYPQPNERPAHAAARLGRAIQGLALPDTLHVGMGLHANLVLTSSDRRPDVGALLSQQAMRLAYLAEPGEILVSAPCSERLADHYLVHHEKRHGTSFRILTGESEGRAVGRMFGRVREFDGLVRLWAHLPLAQTPTAMIMRGEAGIGKSLLTRVMSDYARHTGGAVCTLYADERHRQTPFYPVLECLLQKTGLNGAGDCLYESRAPQDQLVDALCRAATADAAMRTRLRRALFPDQEHGLDRREKPDTLSPDLLRIVIDVLTQRSEPRCPLLVVWEDIHWADSASLTVLDAMMRHTPLASTMVLLTTRDEFVCAGNVRELLLKPLERQAIAELVAHRAKGERLSAKLRARLVDESGGVPFYAEEMLRQVIAGADIGITPLIADIMAARLSSSSAETRQAAQLAAVAGNVDVALMALACQKLGWDAGMLPSALDALRRHGWIDDRTPAEFRHALMRDAIARTLSAGQRRLYRTCIAQCQSELAESMTPTQTALPQKAAAREANEAVMMEREATVICV